MILDEYFIFGNKIHTFYTISIVTSETKTHLYEEN